MGIIDKMQDFVRHIEQQLQTVDGEIEKIHLLILLQLTYFDKNQAMSTIMLSEEVFHLNAGLKRKLEVIIGSRYRLLTSLLQAAQDKKLIITENVTDLASLIMGTIRMIIFQWKLENYRFSLSQRGKSIVSVLLKMMLRNK